MSVLVQYKDGSTLPLKLGYRECEILSNVTPSTLIYELTLQRSTNRSLGNSRSNIAFGLRLQNEAYNAYNIDTP